MKFMQMLGFIYLVFCLLNTFLPVLLNNITYATNNHFWFKNTVQPQPQPQPDVIRHFNPMSGMTVIGACDWEIQVIFNEIKQKLVFSNFSCMFLNPIFLTSFNYNSSDLFDLRNLLEQVEKAFCYQTLF